METQVPLARSRVHQPCAACRMLRRRCDNNCMLSPYFPIEEIEKFAGVHKVFGAGNVIKMIQMVEEAKREDTVKAIVYEAMARLRDPVYGSAGTIFHLQKMVNELQAELETTSAQVLELRAQRDQLQGFLMNVHFLETLPTVQMEPFFEGYNNGTYSQDDHHTIAYDPINFPFHHDETV